jgi:hypothetical protein
MNATSAFLPCLIASSPLVVAAPRSSAHYSITAEATDTGGRRATSASYSHEGSAGLITGVSSIAAPAQSAKHGYIAQLFDVTGLLVNAAAPSVDESGTLQLAAWQLLDDATFLPVPAASVSWSIVSGPIVSIDASGLATAGLVFQNTPASVQGALGSFTGSLNLTVLDAIADNFGAYAGDGLGDDWQVDHFGFDNPLAAPGLDPDGDGQTNAFEFIADLVPTDPNSVFRVRIEAVPGQPAQRRLVFRPRFANRTYTLKATTDLRNGAYLPVGGASVSDAGDERTVTDPAASSASKFYQIEVGRP